MTYNLRLFIYVKHQIILLKAKKKGCSETLLNSLLGPYADSLHSSLDNSQAYVLKALDNKKNASCAFRASIINLSETKLSMVFFAHFIGTKHSK